MLGAHRLKRRDVGRRLRSKTKSWKNVMHKVSVTFVALLAAACSVTTSNDTQAPEGGDGDDGVATETGSSTPADDDATPPPPSGDRPSPGFLRANGSKLVDSSGQTVRLTGVSWFGLETETFAPHGLHVRKFGDMLDQIASVGFNVIRVPFSNQALLPTTMPNGINYNENPELTGLSSIQLLDAIVAGAKERGLKILLDRHRPTASGQSNLWYTQEVSEQKWIDDWKMLAQRYIDNPTVIGADIHNEPHGEATWGNGKAETDWRLAAERAGDAILSVNPNWLIVVEGVEVHDSHYYWWGGNLRGAKDAPVRLSKSDRVVYSPHDYCKSVYSQPWFDAPGYPANLAGLWTDTWGYLATSNTAPILIGELGTRLQIDSDKQWLAELMKYVEEHGLSFTFWSWNPNSGDTGGILKDDWSTLETEKVTAIKPALAPLIP